MSLYLIHICFVDWLSGSVVSVEGRGLSEEAQKAGKLEEFSQIELSVPKLKLQTDTG